MSAEKVFDSFGLYFWYEYRNLDKWNGEIFENNILYFKNFGQKHEFFYIFESTPPEKISKRTSNRIQSATEFMDEDANLSEKLQLRAINRTDWIGVRNYCILEGKYSMFCCFNYGEDILKFNWSRRYPGNYQNFYQ